MEPNIDTEEKKKCFRYQGQLLTVVTISHAGATEERYSFHVL